MLHTHTDTHTHSLSLPLSPSLSLSLSLSLTLSLSQSLILLPWKALCMLIWSSLIMGSSSVTFYMCWRCARNHPCSRWSRPYLTLMLKNLQRRIFNLHLNSPVAMLELWSHRSLLRYYRTHWFFRSYMRRFTSTVPARGARTLNRAISNSCLWY